MHHRIPSSLLFGLSLSLVMFACDKPPAEPPAKPSAPSTPEVKAAPQDGAPNEAKPQPAVEEAAPDEAPTPTAVDDPAAAPTAEPESKGSPAAVKPKEGAAASTKTPAKTFTDCKPDETFADGRCFATHEAACKALGCAADKCVALKSMPPQAKCM